MTQETTTPAQPDDQPKAGLMWLCKACQDGLVARGVAGSGYCRECFDAAPQGGEPAR